MHIWKISSDFLTDFCMIALEDLVEQI